MDQFGLNSKCSRLLVILLSVCFGSLYGQTGPVGSSLFIQGSSYPDRCKIYIDQTVKVRFSAAKISTTRFGFIYVAARLLRGTDEAYALSKLDSLVARASLKNESPGSVQYFTLYQVMHTFMLCRHKIPPSIQQNIKNLMQLYSYNFAWGGTLNLTVMPHAAAYMAAQTWPDFIDASGRNSPTILSYSGNILKGYLSDFFHEGCYEADSPIYYSTNLAPVRMLSDFSEDPTFQRQARAAYHAMLAGMAGAYNKGLYVATPSRSKNWDQLGDGLRSPQSLHVINWFFHGTATERLYYRPGSANESFNFWLAYPGYTQPLPELLQSHKERTYPYVRTGYMRKYTYQSDQYGLATWDIHTKREDHFRESKANYLAWQSQDAVCHFTVWLENRSPRSTLANPDANPAGMGENPYCRIRQHESTAMGVWNVPETYEFFRMVNLYPNTTIKGIRRSSTNQGWVICHTGTMMFAIYVPGTFTWNASGSNEPSGYQGVQRLATRQGFWIMETTEITTQLRDPNRNVSNELTKFEQQLAQNTSIQWNIQNPDLPRLVYRTVKGDTLDLTYHSFDVTYVDQFKVNSTVIDKYLNVIEDPFMRVKYTTSSSLFLTNPLEILNKNNVVRTVKFQEAPTSKIQYQVKAGNLLNLSTNQTSGFSHWILPPGAVTQNNTHIYSQSPDVKLGAFSDSLSTFDVTAFVDDGKINFQIYSEKSLAQPGNIRFNKSEGIFEGFNGKNWTTFHQKTPLLAQVSNTPIAAFSLRRVVENYTGTCVRVRRSSDQKTADFGFTANGLLDTTALLTFAGSSSLFVTVWFDQSENKNHLRQNTTTRQPRIVLNGKLEKVGSFPAINTLGTSTMSPSIAPGISFDNAYFSIVKSNNVSTNTGGSFTLTNLSGSRYFARTGANLVFSAGNFSSNNYFINMTNPLPIDSWHLYSFKVEPGTSTKLTAYVNSIYKDAVSKPTENKTTNLFTAFSGPSNDLDNGKFGEFIVFPMSLNLTEQIIVERNQMRYWK